MTEPLRFAFEVACPPRHAFDVWTTRIDSWWPRDHTVSGEHRATIVLQDRLGGRIYERTGDGVEHLWGEITVWNPPDRFAYRWHLAQDPADATEVDIRFLPHGAEATRVEIEHRGWDRLGPRAPTARRLNQAGWDALVPHYVAAIEEEQHR